MPILTNIPTDPEERRASVYREIIGPLSQIAPLCQFDDGFDYKKLLAGKTTSNSIERVVSYGKVIEGIVQK